MTSPREVTNGPPELPGLSAASVWMTSSINRPDCDLSERPRALTTPAVTAAEYASSKASSDGAIGWEPEFCGFSLSTSRRARFILFSFARLKIQPKFKHEKLGCKPRVKDLRPGAMPVSRNQPHSSQ